MQGYRAVDVLPGRIGLQWWLYRTFYVYISIQNDQRVLIEWPQAGCLKQMCGSFTDTFGKMYGARSLHHCYPAASFGTSTPAQSSVVCYCGHDGDFPRVQHLGSRSAAQSVGTPCPKGIGCGDCAESEEYYPQVHQVLYSLRVLVFYTYVRNSHKSNTLSIRTPTWCAQSLPLLHSTYAPLKAPIIGEQGDSRKIL